MGVGGRRGVAQLPRSIDIPAAGQLHEAVVDGGRQHFTAVDGDEAVDDAGDGADGAEQDEVHEAASRGVQIEQAFLAYLGTG